VLEALKEYPQWRIMVLPDHPTPVRTCGHSRGPVPFAMAGTGVSGRLKEPFSESHAAQSGLQIENGHELMEYFLKS
jgi:2,3-bisphosphoglycerate-independent phosphoglycerate mutase